ncbi:DUF3322 domain-containing protein [Pseudomonas syringae USA007]|uniref:DUF3322 domain-containing protein n=1 Tax=Pseudomonas syringae USA007 TaxID=1357288 RepID=A0AAU8MFF6_PSESX|nr:DUF3322 and DUF2220 domain-containing protein [Pseudomonas syringae]
MRSWGRLPTDVMREVERLEWDNATNLRGRLQGTRRFPISLTLKPPAAGDALMDIDHFHNWVNAWRQWSKQSQVKWVTRRYRVVGDVEVPERLDLRNVKELIEAIGPAAVKRSHIWAALMEPLLAVDRNLYDTLIRQILVVEQMSHRTAQQMAKVLPQLRKGIGAGYFLRGVPVQGIDTKFLETYNLLLTTLLDVIHSGELSEAGGLDAWLGCLPTPSNWLYIRPLCPEVRQQMGGFSVIQIPLEQFLEQPLPGRKVLVVENTKPGYALPELPETVAIFGGGRNTQWRMAPWLAERDVAYWGDIDSWGLTILAHARQALPGIKALMMDHETLMAHMDFAVEEPRSTSLPAIGLHAEESMLFEGLIKSAQSIIRLEQEYLAQDYVLSKLYNWANGCTTKS